MGIAHVAVDFGLGDQGGNRVDHDDVDGAGANQCIDDLEGLFTGVRLGDEQLVEVDPETAGVERIKGVLCVDIGRDTTEALGFGDDMEGEGGFTGGFRAVDLGDPAARNSADAQRKVKRDGASRDRVNLHGGVGFAHLHDGALAKLALDLGDGEFDCAITLRHWGYLALE